mmetsp:Transcript_13439/g.57304  ORF Transcript_13439/g.57304 Transcript_13439/m.57304 type:complete len:250 (-) Transcript_13439:5640-6389(-)
MPTPGADARRGAARARPAATRPPGHLRRTRSPAWRRSLFIDTETQKTFWKTTQTYVSPRTGSPGRLFIVASAATTEGTTFAAAASSNLCAGRWTCCAAGAAAATSPTFRAGTPEWPEVEVGMSTAATSTAPPRRSTRRRTFTTRGSASRGVVLIRARRRRATRRPRRGRRPQNARRRRRRRCFFTGWASVCLRTCGRWRICYARGRIDRSRSCVSPRCLCAPCSKCPRRTTSWTPWRRCADGTRFFRRA